ACR
ncbi:Protein of unknown function, partial [Gryllus bimaculatus]